MAEHQTVQEIIFHPQAIEFVSYPISVASVAKRPYLDRSNIKEIRLCRYPPEVVTLEGEVLFIPRRYRKHLCLFARVNSVPIIERVDAWSLLTEPFLNTEFDEDHKLRTRQQLQACGFSQSDITTIREHISKRMRRYYSLIRERGHLGLYDVLRAFGFSNRLCFFKKRALALYDEFNRISHRANIIADDKSRMTPEALLAHKIDSLASDILQTFGSSPHSKRSFQDRLQDQTQCAHVLKGPILSNYSQPHRAYHSVGHVLSVLDYCEVLYDEEKGGDYDAVRLAALFHDIIYDPTRNDNEEKSADLLRSEAGLDKWVSQKDLQLASELIIMTKDHFGAHTYNEKVLSDADLSILSEENRIYDDYGHSIRQEYAHIEDAAFNHGRLAFLKGVLNYIVENNRLYHFLHPLHEAQAVKNLNREYDNLTLQISQAY